MNVASAFFIAALVFPMGLATASPPATERPISSQNKELLDRILISRDSYQGDKSLEEVIDLGPSAAPEIRQYLNGTGYERALYVLSQMPEVARESTLEALQSPHEGMLLCALDLAEPFLVAGDVEVIAHWSTAFCSVTGNAYMLPSRYGILSKVEPSLRAPAEATIIECLTNNMPKHDDANDAVAMINLLGRHAQPGDVAVMNAIRSVQRDIDTQFTNKLFNMKTSPNRPSDRVQVLEACRFALANLGDEVALDNYLRDVQAGPNDVRSRSISLLAKFHPKVELLEASLVLLSEQAILIESTSEVGTLTVRTCDWTMHALDEWFDSFPVHTSLGRKATAAELAEANVWIAAKIADLEHEKKASESPSP